MNDTIRYYNEFASQFIEGTEQVQFSETQERFLSHLVPGSKILDFGCGSGRDSRYFIEKGFQVEPTDGSEEICELASRSLGIPVKQLLFQDLSAVDEYDGIWACASILHLPKAELENVFPKMVCALKENGVIYISFKYGSGEGMRGGRYFTDFTEISLVEFLSHYSELKTEELWISHDARPERSEEKWVNAILRKV